MERMMDNETFDEVLNGFKEADSIVKRLKTRIAELEEENNVLRENVNHRAGRCADLSEENERLKDNVEFLHSCLDDRDKSIAIMEEENEKLKEEKKKLQNNLETIGGAYFDR